MSASPCVAFVDDEPHLLSGIRRALRAPSAPSWQTAFLESADDVLALVDHHHVDAVVSDMRLLGTDGASLLAQVRREHPDTVRIVLSGQADPQAIRVAVSSAHQFLTKPCPVPTLVAAVDRALAVRDALGTPELQCLLGGISTLPALPAVYHELVEAMGDDGGDVATVAAILARDLAMTTEVLRLVNSSFFGLPREVESVEQAVALLGLDNLQALVLAGSLFTRGDPVGEAQRRQVRDRALRRMAATRRVGAAAGTVEPAELNQLALAALLRDVGLLALAPWRPEAAARLRERVAADPGSELDSEATAEAERAAFGCTVAQASACLLGLWAFPDGVVHAVAREPATGDDVATTLADQVLTFAHQWVVREDARSVGGAAGVEDRPWPVSHSLAEQWSRACRGA